jgi:hypothetical protein
MVSTRNTRFQSPINSKHNKKQTIKSNSRTKLKHKYNKPNKTSRITDHLIKKSKENKKPILQDNQTNTITPNNRTTKQIITATSKQNSNINKATTY